MTELAYALPRELPERPKHPRLAFRHKGRWFCWKSDHPLESRLIELTDDYKDADGDLIIPEAVAWDGVDASDGILLGPVEDD
jgi:hypothetical protein